MTYNEFIQNIIYTRGQWSIPEDGYFEKHHIIPACMGGQGDFINSKSKSCFYRNTHNLNCIYLTYEEHYEAHRLLALENPDNKGLLLAWHRIHTNPRNKGNLITKEEYSNLRKLMHNKISESMSGQGNPNWGNVGYLHHRYGKRPWNYGLKMDESIKDKKRGKNNPMYGKCGGLHHNSKKVINFTTGEIYECLIDAAKAINGSRIRLSKSIKSNKIYHGCVWGFID